MTSDRQFAGLLAAAAMGVYLLVAVGATTAITDAAAACSGWPACGGGFALPTSADGWFALGHRIGAGVVGLLLLAATAVAWRRGESRRVKGALLVALALFPLQSGVGAIIATTAVSATAGVSTLHLALGVAIFGGVLAALAWSLEAATGDPDDTPEDPIDDELPPVEDTPSPELPDPGWPRTKAKLAAYFRLTKPRLMWLLCLVASAAMALAGGANFTVPVVAKTLAAGALSIGASGTFNHVLERDVDRRMQRTSDRPLAVDLVPVRNAVAFGLVLAAISVGLFASINLLAAVLGITAIAFYSVVYTLILKPNTVQNTVIGGAAGALPALIGWAAVTGEIGWGGIGLATVVFLWTPAHFYNLALAYKDDYAAGGFPMMPVVRGETTTRRHILWYLGATLAASAALALAARLDWLFVAFGVALAAVFLWAVVRLHFERTEAAAFRAFHASNAYLGGVLLAVVIDTLVF
ncbi:heme o synthase [Halolamina litorea]|uniref:Protoheme IX farnesyltransferase n=1 Tax=Halolamina litorea TaxID=1515593 RepID=A0ABD6BRY7_9EURY